MMKRTIHLLIPMSGQGTRYLDAGYTDPKPLIEINGQPMIQRLMSCFPEQWPCTFVLAENHLTTRLPDLLRTLRPQGQLLSVPPHTKGPGLAVQRALEQIGQDEPVLVSYCDYSMVWDCQQFERYVAETDCDACVLSYRGFHAHYLSPCQYAYSRLNGNRVVEVKEKGSFTTNRENEFASSGGYYFKSANLLRQALNYQMEHNISLNGEYYTSLTMEALLRCRPDSYVRVFEIPGFFQWGTPEDLQNFEYWESTFGAVNRHQRKRPRTKQILMPMAGSGSRFRSTTSKIKPLIPIGDLPMYQAALESLPQADRVTLVATEAMRQELCAMPQPPDQSIVFLPKTPPGQAFSTQSALSSLKRDEEVIVTACDHAVSISEAQWLAFREQHSCEAAIFTIRGFPKTARRPGSFSYVKAQPNSHFPLVEGVSVKKPYTNRPLEEELLVGTFWFKSVDLLAQGIEALIQKDLRVNGEVYLDSIFIPLLELGKEIRLFPLEGYVGWGDPDSLAEAFYWQEIFGGTRLVPRSRFPFS